MIFLQKVFCRDGRTPAGLSESLVAILQIAARPCNLGEDELSMGKTEEDLLTQMLGEEERPFLTAGGTQIKPFAGEGAEIVVNPGCMVEQVP